MKCHRCGKSLGGSDRVLIAGGKTVCGDCGRKKEPKAYTNGARAIKAARKRALVTGYPVSVTLLPDENQKRVMYYVKVRRRESGIAIVLQSENT